MQMNIIYTVKFKVCYCIIRMGVYLLKKELAVVILVLFLGISVTPT